MEPEERDYGSNVKLRREIRPGHNPEYRVLVGKFVVKTYTNETEAVDYAEKLVERKRAVKR